MSGTKLPTAYCSVKPDRFTRHSLLLLATILLAALSLSAPAQIPDSYVIAKQQSLRILAREDSLRVVEYITTLGSPRDVMGVFVVLSRDLYWENRNIPAAMAIGRAGIQYGITEAARQEDQDVAYQLRSEAKDLAYDLSSFCWPGWSEPGIVIDDSELVLAQDLAKVNLRLALALNKGDLPLSRAYWLIGAHHLAVEQHEAARRAFVEGTKFAIAAGAREQELLLRGYVYLSDMLKDPDNAELGKEFDFILKELDTSREGSFYREQLETAHSVFIGKPGN